MLNESDLSRTDLNLLVLFEAVLKEGHVGRAAERMHVSPSAVSHGLGRLRALLNDPLFIRTPKGVVPTARASELSEPIAEVLARARKVLSTAMPFDAARSTRRFTVAAPDGVSVVFLQPLLKALRRAPGIDLGIRQLLPVAGQTRSDQPWSAAFAELESRTADVAIIPSDEIPARFHSQTLFEEDFVIAMRAGHPFARKPTLQRFCEMQHLVVSLGGDPHGFVDDLLARRGLGRRTALTVPNFMFALAILAESDLISALPRHLTAMHAKRFGLVVREPPLPLGRFRLNAVAPKAAMMDAGLAWLFEALSRAAQGVPRRSGLVDQ